MSKPKVVIRIAARTLAAAVALYLLTAVAVSPENPTLFRLREMKEEMDRFWDRLRTKPLIYPSRRAAIRSFIDTGGGRALEGFVSVKDFSGARDHIQSYTWPIFRRKVETWKVRNNRPGESVTWVTAACPESAPTTFVFSGALGVRSGKSELLISGEPILVFDTGPDDRPQVWENRNVRLAFFPLRKYIHETGIFCLTVPADLIAPGLPLLLGVRRKSGNFDHSFFALHDYRDTLERVSGY